MQEKSISNNEISTILQLLWSNSDYATRNLLEQLNYQIYLYNPQNQISTILQLLWSNSDYPTKSLLSQLNHKMHSYDKYETRYIVFKSIPEEKDITFYTSFCDETLESVAVYPNLTSLAMSPNTMYTDVSWEGFNDLVYSCPFLTSLTIDSCNIARKGAYDIMMMIGELEELRQLKFSGCYITDSVTSQFGLLPVLESLSISFKDEFDGPFSRIGVQNILNFQPKLKSLEIINIKEDPKIIANIMEKTLEESSSMKYCRIFPHESMYSTMPDL